MKQESRKLGVPYPALTDINLASQKLSIPGLQQEPKNKPEFKLVLIAGAIEEYAPDDMPDRPDDEKAADQHEIASLLQQRLEIALDIRRPRARMLGILGLHQLLQIFPGKRDGVVDGQEPVFGLIEHHATHELGERGGSGHARHRLLKIAVPAQARAALETGVDTDVRKLLDRGMVAVDVELDAGLLPAPLHRHEADLLLERTGRGCDGERKAQLFHGVRERRPGWQLATEKDVSFHRHDTRTQRSATMEQKGNKVKPRWPFSTRAARPLSSDRMAFARLDEEQAQFAPQQRLTPTATIGSAF